MGALHMWRNLRVARGDRAWCKIVNDAQIIGVDLNFPTPEGETVLYMAALQHYSLCVQKLLAAGVKANVQVSEEDLYLQAHFKQFMEL